MKFLIVKIVNDFPGEQIKIYPEREGDYIVEYNNLVDAELWIQNNKNNPIYSDCTLKILEDNNA
jgi:hypothetical protein